MGWWRRLSERLSYGRIEADLLSWHKGDQFVRVLITGKQAPFRCRIAVEFVLKGGGFGSDGGFNYEYSEEKLITEPVRTDLEDLQDLLARAIRREVPRVGYTPVGLRERIRHWLDDRCLGLDRCCIGRLEGEYWNLSVILLGPWGSPANGIWRPTAGAMPDPAARIVLRLKGPSDLAYVFLTDADARMLMAALKEAERFPLAA